MTGKAGSTARTGRARGKGKRDEGRRAEGRRDAAAFDRPTTSGFDELVDRGKEQGYLLEEDIEALFEDEAEPPDQAQLEAIHQALVDAGVEVVSDASELQQTIDDIHLDTQLDRLEA